MPSFTLTPSQLSRFSLLPGHVLIRLSAAETRDGLVHLPETAAENATIIQATREGVVVMVNRMPMKVETKRGNVKRTPPFMWGDHVEVREGVRVMFLIHGDEVENEYVVAKFGQVSAVID